jgi:hypothetical protein
MLNQYSENQKILIVGTVRNCFDYLEDNINKISNAFKKFSNIHWFIVESDSSDDTLLLCSQLKKDLPNFHYKSLGQLEATIPLRTERIAYCRNYYLDEINKNSGFADVDLLVVCDLDKNAQSHLSIDGVMSCFDRNDWDVCTANQAGKYYDIWALRHPLWSPNDCWQTKRFLQTTMKLSEKKATYSAVYSRMIHIAPETDWIAVDSAFGGTAIYKIKFIQTSRYVGKAISGTGNYDEVCEHVAFHNQLAQNGAKIFINPKLINTSTNEHSVQSIVPGILKLEIESDPPAVMPQLLNIACTSEDVIGAYKIFLGRHPESMPAIGERVGKSTDSLLVDFLSSQEFLDNKEKQLFILSLANRILKNRNANV